MAGPSQDSIFCLTGATPQKRLVHGDSWHRGLFCCKFFLLLLWHLYSCCWYGIRTKTEVTGGELVAFIVKPMPGLRHDDEQEGCILVQRDLCAYLAFRLRYHGMGVILLLQMCFATFALLCCLCCRTRRAHYISVVGKSPGRAGAAGGEIKTRCAWKTYRMTRILDLPRFTVSRKVR